MAWTVNAGSLAAGASVSWYFHWTRWPGIQVIVARSIPTGSGGLRVVRPGAKLAVSPPTIEVGSFDLATGEPTYTYHVRVTNDSSVPTTFQWEGVRI